MPRSKTYRYNLYKIEKGNEVALKALLITKGMTVVGTDTFGNYQAAFYLCSTPNTLDDVPWAEQYGDLIPPARRADIVNSSHYAALVLSSPTACYAIPLGKAHFYLREFASPDFGMDLASRIADEASVVVVNSRSFGGKKGKSIETYSSDAALDMDSGESLDYLRANTIDPVVWGRTGSFGVSALLTLKTPVRLLGPDIDRIEAELAKPALFEPQRAILVRTAAVRAQLEVELAAALTGSQSSATVQVSQVSLAGIEFVFADTYRYVIHGPNASKSDELEAIDLNVLRAFGIQYGVSLAASLGDIRIKRVSQDGHRGYSEKLRQAISFVMTLHGRHYFLKDGKWFEFTENYIARLLDSVKSIAFIPPDPSHDLSVSQHTAWKLAHPAPPPNYKEIWYNTHVLCAPGNGLTVYDRKFHTPGMGYKIEPLDVYESAHKRFIMVKRYKDDTGDFAYLIDQAITAIKVLGADNKIKVAGANLICRRAQLLIVSKGHVFTNIADVKSLLILQKLNAFRIECHRRNIEPEIRCQKEIL